MATITDFLISGFTVTDIQPQYKNQANSGRLITRSTGIQYFQVQFQVNVSISDRLQFQQFLAEYSQGKAFAMSLGYYSTYTGIQTGTIATIGSSVPGMNKVQLPTATKLEKGTLIQFSGHKKIYRILDNTSGVLTVFPNLRQPVQKSETVTYKDIQGTFILNMDKNQYEYKSEQVIQTQFTAIEDITA